MAKIDLLQGTLDMLVLKALSKGQMHGYDVAKWIKNASDEALQVEEGSLYPSLYRMEQKGWIKSTWGTSQNNRKARFYSLTAAGRKQFLVESSSWSQMTEAISKIMQTA